MLHELLDGVVRTGEAFWAKDLLFLLERHGFLEETYFDVSYDPVRDESGASAACSASSPRRPGAWSASGGSRCCATWRRSNATARTARDACAAGDGDAGGATPQDVPFALAYLDGDAAGLHARRARRRCGRSRSA